MKRTFRYWKPAFDVGLALSSAVESCAAVDQIPIEARDRFVWEAVARLCASSSVSDSALVMLLDVLAKATGRAIVLDGQAYGPLTTAGVVTEPWEAR